MKYPEMAEGNRIENPGRRAKKNRDISFIITVGKEKKMRPDTV